MMDSILMPCLLYGGETWMWTAELLGQVLTAERQFYRWCMRIQAPPNVGGPQVATTLADWITWQSATARDLASYTATTQRTRWTHCAMNRLWAWAGQVARLAPENDTRRTSSSAVKKRVRGRPPPAWHTPLQRFSAQELGGSKDIWQDVAPNPKSWDALKTTFTDFVHLHIMTAQARDSIRRDEQA